MLSCLLECKIILMPPYIGQLLIKFKNHKGSTILRWTLSVELYISLIINEDVSHPSPGLFILLPSRRRRQYKCIKAGAERLKNSFYLQAISRP